MSKQDGTQPTIKQRRNRKTNTANQQNGKQALTVQRPTNDDKEAWKNYWKTQGQSWRTEPEIDLERQKYLNERRNITSDIEQGIYPFKDIKLSRADVEWLLATHENGRGPVDWSDEKSLHERIGLDLRGADLQQVNLDNLPLTHMRGGLDQDERQFATAEQGEMAAVHFEGASLRRTRLERAILYKARLEKANLSRVHLERANLVAAHFEKTYLRQAHIEGAYLERCILGDENGIGPSVLNVRWGNTILAVVKWSQIKMLADEYVAQHKMRDGKAKEKDTRLDEYERAVLANRQVSVALQAQGLNEDAAHFAYRAQKLQRIVLRRQRKFGSYLFSEFLDLLAGYGYRPGRSVFWYLVIIVGFAMAYHILGQVSLFPPDAFVYSLTSFHGRGFFPGLEHRTHLHDPLVMLAAIEAVVGLFIEISFIATFTKRFYGS